MQSRLPGMSLYLKICFIVILFVAHVVALPVSGSVIPVCADLYERILTTSFFRNSSTEPTKLAQPIHSTIYFWVIPEALGQS
ncbi:uncharacterized protein C8R40DRAFT_783518 [Lentinula edodes]|uniref:uncharacterized protein n=1 Tax=Lentinula edodes TaxID=5353 RepID=UPI001E8E745F|nr:uncharacterized protein C8R40DRAFT_783518 [Lentinula edodes]KAH7878709.1 hypothetical protein C8R40DRAFT_783518 [Lentinula edodes]